MRVTDSIPKEKMMVFHKAAYEISKHELQEDISKGIKNSRSRNRDEPDEKAKLVNTFCDGYVWGMSTAMALVEAGIINIQTLEIKRKVKGE